MKMKLYHRLILVIGALITFLIGLGLIVTACGLFSRFTLVPQAEGESFFSWRRIAVIAAGAFLVLFGGYTMLFPGKLRYNRKDFIVQKGEKGDLLFSVKTLEALVRECVDMHKEIEVKTLRIVPGKEGVVVRLRVVMASNISMPLVQDSLAGQIKQYVTASSGVQVKSVNVAVVGVAGKAGENASPYAVTSEEEADASRESRQKEKKLPHLRLFDKEEEQAVVPVAEAASEAAAGAAAAAETAAEAAAGVSEAVEAGADAVTEGIKAGTEYAAEKAGDAMDAAAQVAGDAAEAVGDAAGQAVDAAADAADSLKAAAEGAGEAVKDTLEAAGDIIGHTEEGHV